jgi:hypothetical protein
VLLAFMFPRSVLGGRPECHLTAEWPLELGLRCGAVVFAHAPVITCIRSGDNQKAKTRRRKGVGIGIDPDYVLHVSERLMTRNDGPMLEALKRLHGGLPGRVKDGPDRDRLALRFERFKAVA